MNATNWKTDAENLLRQVDPGLCSPVYLVGMDEIGTAPGNAVGCWSPLFDLQLREIFRQQNRWAGRGFCCLVDATGTKDRFQNAGIPAADIRRRILATVVHEFAHYVDARPLLPESDVDAILATSAEPSKLLAMPITVGEATEKDPPWKGHDGARFGRLCIHLWHRSIMAGETFHINDVYSPADFYWLSSPLEYVEALGDEPSERAAEPLREIVNSQPPADYAEFCRRDLEDASARLCAKSQQHFPKE